MTWLQKRKLAKKIQRMRKHTSGVTAHHFLPDPPNMTPPNVTSRGVPKVAVRKGGQRRTRKHERWCDSEVAMKKMPMNTAESVDDEGQSESDPPFREAVRRFKITRACEKTRTTRGTGTGGARAAISRPEAVPATTLTRNPCGLAHP